MSVAGEGFDLDAIPDSSQNTNDDVIYELGGSATAVPSAAQTAQTAQTAQDDTDVPSTSINRNNDPTFESEECKRQGNEFFKKKDFLNAYDRYTDAIEACPGMKGHEIVQLKDDHEAKEREKANQRYLRDTDRTHRRNRANDAHNDPQSQASTHNANNDDKDLEPTDLELPPHQFATQLAVYYSNRAACLLHECRYDDAIKDCEIAILLNPKYTKAYIRRMTAYENTEQTEEALRDAKTAQSIEPNNKDVQKHVKRLQRIEDERMEKLKEETMGKLKDLGNSILGNFGLSMDNFKAQQDPSTGSYNISFQN